MSFPGLCGAAINPSSKHEEALLASYMNAYYFYLYFSFSWLLCKFLEAYEYFTTLVFVREFAGPRAREPGKVPKNFDAATPRRCVSWKQHSQVRITTLFAYNTFVPPSL